MPDIEINFKPTCVLDVRFRPDAPAVVLFADVSAGQPLSVTLQRVLQGPPGEDGSGRAGAEEADKNYVHNQGVSSAVWTITHSLDKYPSVYVIDSVGDAVEGAVQYLTANQLTVTFSAAFSGSAILN
jgi:hypothetical protein